MAPRTRSSAGVLSTWNSYHGKTLGALSASGRTQYHGLGVPAEGRRGTALHLLHVYDVRLICPLRIRIAPGFEFVAFGDADALRSKFEDAQQRGAQYAAFLVEPIQGEGGTRLIPRPARSSGSFLLHHHHLLHRLLLHLLQES